MDNNSIIEKITELVKKGNVSRILVRKGDKILVDVPVNVGIVGGVAVLAMSKVLLIAGVLATVEWRYAFLVYLAGLLALVLVSIFLPNESLRGNAPAGDDAQQRAAKPSTLKLLKRFHPSVTAMFLTMLLFFVYPTNFALTAHGQGIDTLTTTLIMVGLDVVAFVIGLCFGGLMRRLRRQMKYVAPLGFVGGYALLAFVPGMGGMIAGSALIGVANGVGVPYLNTIASIKGGRDAAVTVMPLISAALYLGQFVSPLVVSPLARLIGSASAPYIVAVGIGVLFLIQMYLTRRQQALPPAA